jgi:hypothetical protein
MYVVNEYLWWYGGDVIVKNRCYCVLYSRRSVMRHKQPNDFISITVVDCYFDDHHFFFICFDWSR